MFRAITVLVVSGSTGYWGVASLTIGSRPTKENSAIIPTIRFPSAVSTTLVAPPARTASSEMTAHARLPSRSVMASAQMPRAARALSCQKDERTIRGRRGRLATLGSQPVEPLDPTARLSVLMSVLTPRRTLRAVCQFAIHPRGIHLILTSARARRWRLQHSSQRLFPDRPGLHRYSRSRRRILLQWSLQNLRVHAGLYALPRLGRVP